jgi:hypothetical protein
MKKLLGPPAPGGTLCIFLILKKKKPKNLWDQDAVSCASRFTRRALFEEFQSAKVRLNTMEIQDEVSLYEKYSATKWKYTCLNITSVLRDSKGY